MSTSQAVCNQFGADMAHVMVNVDIGCDSSLLIHPNMTTKLQAFEAVGLRKSVKVTVGQNISPGPRRKYKESQHLQVRIVLIILSILVLFVLVVWAAFIILNRTNGSLTSAGEQRRYLLYIPDSYDPSTPTPLVISIHGFAEWPAHQQQISHWNELADEYGFLVVYPMGTSFPLRWRTNDDTDLMQDVTFISDLIEKLESEYNVDPDRIYANGLSNGGGMSFTLSCKLSERIAAIGGVAGAYLLPWDSCTSSRPVPAIIFHGNADPIVPFAGGPSSAFDIPFPRIDDWVQTLAQHNGCIAEPQALTRQGDASGIRYTGCDQNADLIYYTIDGGGHTWPGGDPLPEWITGANSDDIDATRLMWEFFQQHPLK